MAKKIEIEAAKIRDGLTYYNCTAYDPSGEVIGFMKELVPNNVLRFIESFIDVDTSSEIRRLEVLADILKEK